VRPISGLLFRFIPVETNKATCHRLRDLKMCRASSVRVRTAHLTHTIASAAKPFHPRRGSHHNPYFGTAIRTSCMDLDLALRAWYFARSRLGRVGASASFRQEYWFLAYWTGFVPCQSVEPASSVHPSEASWTCECRRFERYQPKFGQRRFRYSRHQERP